VTDEENAEYNRMCLAVLCADKLHRTQAKENERLRAELAAHKDTVMTLDSFRLKLEAENERLRANERECKEVATRNATDCQHLRRTAIAQASSLADATKLLERIGPWLHNSSVPAKLAVDVENFIANQPAAPTRTEASPLDVLWKRQEAEQAVLDACAAMTVGDDEPDADPLEPQELGEDCYIYTDDQCRIVRAELALRGLK
jgi:hypothetical protein